MLEDPFYYREEAKHQRAYIRRVVGLGIAACLVFALAKCAYAEPIVQAEVEGVVVTVYSEPCQIPEVSNLPRRATWVEKGKTFEGCAGAIPQIGLALFYFKEDRTVTAITLDQFRRLTGV